MRPSVIRTFSQSASTLSKRRIVRIQLTTNIPGLGKVGDLCLVPPGRMRNFLLPERKAIYKPLPTTSERAQQLLHKSADKSTPIKPTVNKSTTSEPSTPTPPKQVTMDEKLTRFQRLGLQRKIEAVAEITFQRQTTNIAATVNQYQLPDSPLTIQDSIAVSEVVAHIREHSSSFRVSSADNKGSSVELTPQQMTETLEFQLVSADSSNTDGVDQAGKIQKTGRYHLQVRFLPGQTKVNVPIVVRPSSSSSSSTTIAASVSASPTKTSQIRAFSTSIFRPSTRLEDTMRSKLEATFSPTELIVRNDSAKHAHHAAMVAQGGGNGETHFYIDIVSQEFQGMPQIKRHRSINTLLATEFENGLHALSLRTRTPSEKDRSVSTTSNNIDLSDEMSSSTSTDSSSSEQERLSQKFKRRMTKNEQVLPSFKQNLAGIAAGVLSSLFSGYMILVHDFGKGENCFSPIRRMVTGEDKPWSLRENIINNK